MSRLLYWTIVIGEEPTAFRARDAADLQPTLVQLRRAHPEAEIRWFQQGRLWSSPEEARTVLKREREEARKRPKTWRPGGTHEDPRQKYKDAKKAKWARFKEAIRKRAERHGDRSGKHGERDGRPAAWRPRSDLPQPDDRRAPARPSRERQHAAKRPPRKRRTP
ncbi:MAG TPA: hypothetical protein VIL35_03670 [Vicinamibacterales bacterium]